MLTETARKHVVHALREALHVRTCVAAEILEVVRNANMLRLLEGRDLRTVKALVSSSSEPTPTADLYLDDSEGYEFAGVTLRLTYEDLDRWNLLPIEEAYALGAEVFAKAGPVLRAANERMAAKAAAQAGDDLLPEEEMDRMFGKPPESRSYAWVDGRILRADVASSGDHVVVLVEKADGTRQTMAMFALFGSVSGLLEYAVARIGADRRLSVGWVNAFDDDVPAGFDRSMPVLDMIMDRTDLMALAVASGRVR